MSLGGLVGFGVLAVVVVTALSVIASAWFAIAAKRLHEAGPVAERSAAAWALLAPIALAATVVVVVAAIGAFGADHCAGHHHHAHFCLAHGGAWLARPWAVAVAAASSVTYLVRLATVVWRRLRARQAIGQVRRVSEPGDRVRIAQSERVFCFVAGWRKPEIFMSSSAWNALSPEQRDAVIAHEQAHVAHGDVLMTSVVDLASTLAAPLAGSWLHARWAAASERFCDSQAARTTAPETVATALVQLCRAGQLQPIASAFTPDADALEARVQAVLANGPVGSRLGWVAWSSLAAAVAMSAVLANHLHHALETLLG